VLKTRCPRTARRSLRTPCTEAVPAEHRRGSRGPYRTARKWRPVRPAVMLLLGWPVRADGQLYLLTRNDPPRQARSRATSAQASARLRAAERTAANPFPADPDVRVEGETPHDPPRHRLWLVLVALRLRDVQGQNTGMDLEDEWHASSRDRRRSDAFIVLKAEWRFSASQAPCRVESAASRDRPARRTAQLGQISAIALRPGAAPVGSRAAPSATPTPARSPGGKPPTASARCHHDSANPKMRKEP